MQFIAENLWTDCFDSDHSHETQKWEPREFL